MKLATLMNAFPSLILRSPLHGLMSDRFLLLSWTGHKTGRSYTTPVAYAELDGRVVMTTDDAWWRNFQRPSRVHLRLRGREVPGTAVAITDQHETRRALGTLIGQQPTYPRLARIAVDADGRPDLDAAIADGRVLVAVEVSP